MAKTISDTPNYLTIGNPRKQELEQQKILTTVIDASGDVPQFDAQGHKEPNIKAL